MKTTEWYPDSTNPFFEGLYETRVGCGLTWSVWKNGFWHYASDDKELCVEMAERGSLSFWQKREWRGLKEPA